MCSERVTNLMEQIQKQKVVELTPENLKALQDMLSLSIQSQEECAICLDDLHTPVITPCAHVFGRECIERVIETQKKCPMCRAELKDNSVLVQPANDFGDEVKDESIDFDASSTKLEALIDILKASKGTGNKTVVFSQWVRYFCKIFVNVQSLTLSATDQIPRYRAGQTRPRRLQILQT